MNCRSMLSTTLALTIATLGFVSTAARGDSTTEWKGTGAKKISKFELVPGLIVFKMKHEGTGTFQIDLRNEKGKFIAMPVTVEGNYSGSQAFNIADGGTYTADITADGPWEISFEQPQAKDPRNLPQSLTGSGDTVSPFLLMKKGTAKFTITRGGDGEFSILLLNENGIPVQQVIDSMGNITVTQSVDIELDAVYLLDISGTGNWTITIE